MFCSPLKLQIGQKNFCRAALKSRNSYIKLNHYFAKHKKRLELFPKCSVVSPNF